MCTKLNHYSNHFRTPCCSRRTTQDEYLRRTTQDEYRFEGLQIPNLDLLMDDSILQEKLPLDSAKQRDDRGQDAELSAYRTSRRPPRIARAVLPAEAPNPRRQTF